MPDVSSEQPQCWMCGKIVAKLGNPNERITITCAEGHEEVSWSFGPKSYWSDWTLQNQVHLLTQFQIAEFVDHSAVHRPCP